MPYNRQGLPRSVHPILKALSRKDFSVKIKRTKLRNCIIVSFVYGAGNRTRFAFSPLEKIMEWFPSSRKPATRPRRVAFRWVRVLFFSIRNIKEEAFGLLFYIWCGQQDSNLHGRPLEPKSNVSANSTMPAYSVES